MTTPLDVILEGGYIRVVQDVRGKHGSEGDYVVNRPLRGPLNQTPVDHATDTWDTIDWLGQECPGDERQGRHPGDLVQRLPALDGAGRPAPGAEGVGADESDGRRLDGRRLVPLRRLPSDQRQLDLQSGRHAQVGRAVVDAATRRVRHVDASGSRPASWVAAAALDQLGFWNKLVEHPGLRRLLARPGRRQAAGGTAAENARDAGPQPLGPGRHLRRPGRLQGDQTEGHGQRQGLPRHRSVASRPDDRQRQFAGGREIRQRHRALLPPENPRARFSTSI